MVVAHVLGSVLGSGRDTVQVHVLTIEGHPVPMFEACPSRLHIAVVT